MLLWKLPFMDLQNLQNAFTQHHDILHSIDSDQRTYFTAREVQQCSVVWAAGWHSYHLAPATG